MSALWRLPGPQRFASQVRNSLDRGFSPVVVLNHRQLTDEIWQRDFTDALDRHLDPVDAVSEPDRPAAAVVAESFGVAGVDPGPDAATSLANHPDLEARTLQLTIAGPDHEHWVEFVRRFVTSGRAVAIEDRPRLLIFTDHRAAASLAPRETMLQPFWWWGVLDRLDTAVHVSARLASARADIVLRDSIVEVAGFDLALADYLAENWDGRPDALEDLLRHYLTLHPHEADPPLPDLPHSSTPHEPPPAGLTDLWARGRVDHWDAFPAYLHPCTLVQQGRQDDVLARVWLAQLRSLMPLIDEERGRLAQWFRQELPAGYALPDPPEAGDLVHAMYCHPGLKAWRGGHRKRLVYWLRDTRNTLAHRGTLTPDEVQQGRQLIAADRR